MTQSPLPKAPDLITIKRGTQPVLVASNYIPAAGEIIGRINTYGYIDKIKVGNGTHKYIDLPFIGEQENAIDSGIRQYLSKMDFPSIGSDQVLYITLDTKTLYYWDITAHAYKETKDLVGVPEAPLTGKKYARCNNAWSAIKELNIKGNIYTAIQKIEEHELEFNTTEIEDVLTFKTLTTKDILECNNFYI